MLVDKISHHNATSSVFLCEAIEGFDGTKLAFDASFGESDPTEKRRIVVAPLYVMSGWGAAILPPEILRWNVQLRQELQLGIMQHELAGWHVRQALAECANELQVPAGTEQELAYRLQRIPAPHFDALFAAEWRETYGVDPETAIIFAPLSELEALRQAIARHIWREMQDSKTRAHLDALLWLLEPIAETHTETLHVCAAKRRLGEEATPVELLRTLAKAHLDNDGVVACLEIKSQIEQIVKRFHHPLEG